MSTTESRMTLNQAIAQAEVFRALFDGFYERWEFAGSVRRRKPTIGDIEHVVMPRWGNNPGEMFSSALPAKNITIERAEHLLGDGTFTKHVYPNGQTRFGKKQLGLRFNNVLHEIYFAEPENWGDQLLIRTGSTEFSRGVMARLNRRGYAHEDNRLWRIVDFSDVSRPGFQLLKSGNVGQFIPCETEEALLEAAGLVPSQWPPERRTIAP